MRKHLVAIGTLILVGIMSFAASAANPIAAQGMPAIIRFSPSPLEMPDGAQGTVAVEVENVNNLYGLELHLSFDPRIVEVADSDSGQAGIQIMPSARWSAGYVAVNRADNATGKIDYAVTMLRPALPVSGNLEIASIIFTSRKVGEGLLQVESALLSTINAEEIRFTAREGKVAVYENGHPPFSPRQSVRYSTGRLAAAAASILALLVVMAAFIILRRNRKQDP